MNNQDIIKFPNGCVRIPDDNRYKCKFEIKSASSNRIYRISYDGASGAMWWTCSCPSGLSRGYCKHLKACGLKGRSEMSLLSSDERITYAKNLGII